MTFSFERTAFWPVQSRKKSLLKPAGSSWAWPRRLWLRTSPSLFVAVFFFKATPKKIDIGRMIRMPLT